MVLAEKWRVWLDTSSLVVYLSENVSSPPQIITHWWRLNGCNTKTDGQNTDLLCLELNFWSMASTQIILWYPLLFCQIKPFETLSVKINTRFVQPLWRNTFSGYLLQSLVFVRIRFLGTNFATACVAVRHWVQNRSKQNKCHLNCCSLDRLAVA